MDLSPKNLFSIKFAVFTSAAYDVTLLFRAMILGMYGTTGNFFYLGPTLTYSMYDVLELAVIGQYFAMHEVATALASEGSSVYVRLKWSF